MKLIIIYGQEATGKLTIAKQLAKITSFKLFHNHVSVDVAKSLYEFGEPEYDDLLVKVRLEVFKSAAKNNIPGLIFTWAYTHPECYDQLKAILETVRPFDTQVHLFHVHCDQQVLEERVASPDRVLMGKISSIDHLHRQQKRKNCIAIPDSNSVVIDNTKVSALDVARQISRHLD